MISSVCISFYIVGTVCSDSLEEGLIKRFEHLGPGVRRVVSEVVDMDECCISGAAAAVNP